MIVLTHITKNMKNMMKTMNTSWLDKYLIHYFSCALMIDNNYIVDYSIENQSTIHLCITTLSADNFIKIYKDISYSKETKQFIVISTTVASVDKVVLQCYYWINQCVKRMILMIFISINFGIM